MLSIPPPMSNAERQRKFQLAHPGYDVRRKARKRASVKREVKRMQAIWQAEALAEQTRTAQATIQIPASKPMLMLPAPVETIEIPGMTTIRQIQAIPAVMEDRVTR